MLTSEGFGFGQAPNSFEGDVEYVVLRGVVINGARRPGDTVFMNPRAQATIELLAQGRIKPVPVVEVEAAVIESPVNRMVDVKRGRKSK
jgi:hypothetical protein